MTDAVLAINAGSSSLKFALFAMSGADEPGLLARGKAEERDGARRLVAHAPDGGMLADRHAASGEPDGHGLVSDLLAWSEEHIGAGALAGVGHRVVHGGGLHVEPARIDDALFAALEALTPLAPLHQPGSLAPIRALRAMRPQLPQVACFDTAFHHDLAPPVSRLALPRRYEVQGLRRFGFHGLSYEYVARRLAGLSPSLADRRTVVAHLGSGASLCAMRHGRSADTTMGFSALDGLVMATRCGAIDPGVLLYLQQAQGLSVAALEHLLYKESGLLGVSGLSGDMQALLKSDAPEAAEAVDLFCFSIARHTAAMANTLGGLECLVFTGGIGEHAAEIRARVGERLGWLGVAIDAAANAAAAPDIGAADSAVRVLIIPTDEEAVIAGHTRDVLLGR
ncbi:acetate/propionate family kinase [Labrys monachus]|uniref:Acetate kinase n=1 Tax=Labrys monachus TaxID=217067 RepID=A0ABU0FLQ6_9HYPH|nr:acetate/propionate family kinase [Labrys monachus]MDQ0395531.1 acetate kinase [Labrys monachus]